MGGVLIGKVIIEAYWWNHGTVELGLGAVAHAPICPDKREGLARPPPTRDLPAALTPPAHPRRLWRMLLANGYRELPVTSEHAIAEHDLPMLHKDPFDRILIAQARTEAMALLTADTMVAAYGEGVQQV